VKFRKTSWVICLIYVAVATVAGMIHHHGPEDCGHEDHSCLACNWQVTGTSDVPVCDVPVLIGYSIALVLFSAKPEFVPGFHLALIRNRAPPVIAA